VTWTFNGGTLPGNTEVSGYWPGLLVIDDVSKKNHGVYVCKGMLKSKYETDHSHFLAAGVLNVVMG